MNASFATDHDLARRLRIERSEDSNMHGHRQLHLWITEHDYAILRDLANARGETLSSVIRRLIKLHRGGPHVRREDFRHRSPAADFWPL